MKHPKRLSTIGAVALVLVAGGALAVATNTSGHSNPLVPTAASNTSVSVGPGPVSTVLHSHRYRLELRLTPNRATAAGTISLKLAKQGRPVNGARVRLTFAMVDMDMGQLTGLLPQTAPGSYDHAGPVLGMGGRWRLRFDVTPRHGKPFSVTVVDRIG